MLVCCRYTLFVCAAAVRKKMRILPRTLADRDHALEAVLAPNKPTRRSDRVREMELHKQREEEEKRAAAMRAFYLRIDAQDLIDSVAVQRAYTETHSDCLFGVCVCNSVCIAERTYRTSVSMHSDVYFDSGHAQLSLRESACTVLTKGDSPDRLHPEKSNIHHLYSICHHVIALAAEVNRRAHGV